MPKDKHLQGVGKKKQRMYEHIVDEAKDDHGDAHSSLYSRAAMSATTTASAIARASVSSP